MKNYIVLSLFFASIIMNTNMAEPPANKAYQLLFEDNFDGDKLNENNWIYREGRRTGGGYINGLNLKQNVYVKDGSVHIDVKYENINGQMEYTGGGIISKAQFGYGYYETSSKIYMAGTGVHTSFWQAGGAFNPKDTATLPSANNNVFEIDSYEIDSKTFLGCNNLYVGPSPKQYQAVPWPIRAHVPFQFGPDGWFMDSYEFTPEGVIFYDNGKEVASVEFKELNAAQVVWLTALNGCGKVETDKLPGKSSFDYFRYYAKDYPGITILPNGNFELNQDKVNPNIPIAWKKEGTSGTVTVLKGGAARDKYKLHVGSDKAFTAKIYQTLQYIINGNYQLTAMVRSSGGQRIAKLHVFDFGGKEMSVDIKATEKWTKISIPTINVTKNGITVALTCEGDANQWLEIDDINFMKPSLAGDKQKKQEPFVLVGDPIYKLAHKQAIKYSGNGKFNLFDRNVGLGDAISVKFTLNADEYGNMMPFLKAPKIGKSGWGILLLKDGSVSFRLGSTSTFYDVIAPNAYKAGKDTKISCVWDKGIAYIYSDGKLLKKEAVANFDTQDKTAPGKMGAAGTGFNAVSVVISKTDKDEKETVSNKSFRGSIGSLKIYNRAMNSKEINE